MTGMGREARAEFRAPSSAPPEPPVEKIGHRLVAEMRREHVNRMIAKRADTPGAANDLLKKIRVLTNSPSTTAGAPTTRRCG